MANTNYDHITGQTFPVDKQLLKQINHYVRAHPFIIQSLNGHTTSERRSFERDVYDYARKTGLLQKQAKSEVRKARGFCGELDYDSDDSKLGDEVDDSEKVPSEALSASLPLPNDVTAPETAIERVHMTIPIDLAGAVIGTGGVKINTIRRLSGSLIEIDDLKSDSNELQITIIGLQKCNQIAIKLLDAAKQTGIERDLKKNLSKKMSVPQYETPESPVISTEAMSTASLSLHGSKTSKKSKKRKAKDVKPSSTLSTSATRKEDRHPKKVKKLKKEGTIPNLVSEILPSDQETSPSRAKPSHSNNSQVKKYRRSSQDHAINALPRPPLNDEATATEEAQGKNEKTKRKRKRKKSEAQGVGEPMKTKHTKHIRAMDPVVLITNEPTMSHSNDHAENSPTVLTISGKANGAAVESDEKSSKKHKMDCRIMEDKGQESRGPNQSDVNPTVHQLDTDAEANHSQKQKRTARQSELLQSSAESLDEGSKKKSKRSKKRKDPPIAAREKDEADPKPKVEKVAPSRNARKSQKHHRDNIGSMVVRTESEETDKDIRSEYFTPTKPKSKVLLPSLHEDFGVKAHETSSSKVEQNPKKGMEECRANFYAELRRRSSLGPTTAGALSGKVRKIAPLVPTGGEANTPANNSEVEDEDTSKVDLGSVKSTEHATKSKNQNMKESLAVSNKEINSLIGNVDSENPGVSTHVTKDAKKAHALNSVDSEFKPLPNNSSEKEEMGKKPDMITVDKKGTTIISKVNETSAPDAARSKATIANDQNLIVPVSPPAYFGWTPVNEAFLNAKKALNVDKDQAHCVAINRERMSGNSYSGDSMVLDHEGWAVSNHVDTTPNSGSGTASRKRKKPLNIKEEGRNCSGILTPAKKPRLANDKYVDFSSPMIR